MTEVMATRKFEVPLTIDEIFLLVEALDSHIYWQLSEPHERRSGYSVAESREVKQAEKLMEKLDKINSGWAG
jgi:hypothetical protein